MRRLLLPVLLVALATQARAEPVMVFAAVSLSDALRELAPAWAAQSGDRVELNFGASSDLARQIIAGAPADAFVSADPAQMDAVERAGLVDREDRVDLLSNVLVVIEQAGSSGGVRRVEDLPAVSRLALADPQAVPAGVYARKWLESIGVWDRVAPRVIPLLDVRAALAAVASGNADAAIVYRTDAALSQRVRIAFEVPRSEGPPIVYVAAPIRRSPASRSRALVAWLASPAARSVFERHGFLAPGVK